MLNQQDVLQVDCIIRKSFRTVQIHLNNNFHPINFQQHNLFISREKPVTFPLDIVKCIWNALYSLYSELHIDVDEAAVLSLIDFMI